MIARLTTAVFAVLLGASLFAPAAPAQGRGTHSAPAGLRSRPGPRHIIGERIRASRRFYDGAAYVYPPYFYGDDEYNYEPETPPAPANFVPPQPPATPARVIEPLLLEDRNGEWVRVPNSSQLSVAPSPNTGSENFKSQISNSNSPIPAPSGRSVTVEPAPSGTPAKVLPPAVIVYRDGRTEELGKYMIEGDTLYTNADYWSTGSWTRKIPLSQVDIPASLKLNQERASKFNLPSRPNEVVVRF